MERNTHYDAVCVERAKELWFLIEMITLIEVGIFEEKPHFH